jgi:hypothetical protein
MLLLTDTNVISSGSVVFEDANMFPTGPSGDNI